MIKGDYFNGQCVLWGHKRDHFSGDEELALGLAERADLAWNTSEETC